MSTVPPGQSVLTCKNDSDDTGENVKKSIWLNRQNNNSARALRIFRSLHDYDVKIPNFTFYGGLTSNEEIFFFSLNLVIVVTDSAPEDGMIAIDLKELEFTF